MKIGGSRNLPGENSDQASHGGSFSLSCQIALPKTYYLPPEITEGFIDRDIAFSITV